MCGRPTVGTRCRKHRLQTVTYDAEYRRNRATIIAGAIHCATCGGPFTPTDRATAGHIVALVDGGSNQLANLKPEHESCNKRGGADIVNR